MKKRSLVFSALAAMVTAGILAGCGNNYYFAGRVLPPSGIANRVLIAIQNPGTGSRGVLQFVDGYYDIRQSFNDKIPQFNISGYSGQTPVTIQNMPEEQIGAVYGTGDGTLSVVNYQKESSGGSVGTLTGSSSSVFISRSQLLVVAASQQSNFVNVLDKANNRSYNLGLPGAYQISMNPGGSVVLAFVQNSDYAYFPRRLLSTESVSLAAYYQAHQSWPAPYVDCEPKNLPGMCLGQVQDSNHQPLVFDRPVKAIFSNDGSSLYVLNCGPECGGKASSVETLPTAPLILQSGQQSGSIPSNPTRILVPGGASNALLDSTKLYVMGQQLQPDGLFGGYLTVVDLTANTAGSPISVSDGAPAQRTRMILADDNTLWLGTIRCIEGERYATGKPYGCLTVIDTKTDTVKLIEPFQGDLTGIAAVTGLHKVYIAEGGQVYIYSTKDGSTINNFYVTVNGTAYDVAYMDAITDGDNTVY